MLEDDGYNKYNKCIFFWLFNTFISNYSILYI